MQIIPLLRMARELFEDSLYVPVRLIIGDSNTNHNILPFKQKRNRIEHNAAQEILIYRIIKH